MNIICLTADNNELVNNVPVILNKLADSEQTIIIDGVAFKQLSIKRRNVRFMNNDEYEFVR